MEQADAQVTVQVDDLTEESDLAWVPERGDGQDAIAEYYEAESWQFSGCGD